MKPKRYPILTDNGIFLCNDGTMWERKSKGYNGVYEWKQIDDIPQPDDGISVTGSGECRITISEITSDGIVRKIF